MDRLNSKKVRIIVVLIFLSLFTLGSFLILTAPSKVKATYGLSVVTKDGETISFNVFEPINGGKKMKAVIIGHGGMASKEFMKGYAIEMAAAGFVAVTLDFRGHGQSTGELDRNGLIYDVKSIKEYLKDRGDIQMDSLGYLGYSMGGGPGNKIVKKDDDFKCFILVGSSLLFDEDDIVKNRSLNILMIQARYDEGHSLEQTKGEMGGWLDMKGEDIETNQLYGSFQDGNASMVYLDDNSDHLLLAWDQDFIREARDWVKNTFPDVEPVDENFYANIRALIFVLQIVGGLGFFFSILKPLSNVVLPTKDEDFHKIEFENHNMNKFSLRAIIFSLVLAIPGILIMSPLLIFLPLTIAGLIAVLLFGQTFGLLILIWRMGKKNDLNLKSILKEPFNGTRERLLREIGLGIILATILYVIIYISVGFNYVGFVPSLYKLPWIPIYFAVNTVNLIIFGLLAFIDAQQIKEAGARDTLKAALLVFAIVMVYIVTIILIPCIIIGNYFVMIFLFIITPTTLLISFVSVVLYKKTGNIIASTIVSVLIITSISCTLAPFAFPLTSSFSSSVTKTFSFGLF